MKEKAYAVIDSNTLALLASVFPPMSQAQAQRKAAELGGSAVIVPVNGTSEWYDPQTGPQQTWLYNTTTKVLVRQ
jgi:hypothetical protein